MTHNLRAEYEAFLSRHGLKARRVPSRQERDATQRDIVRIMYEEARARDDPYAEELLIHYEKNRDRYVADTRHPSPIELERVAAEIEATIHAIPEFAAKFRDKVFVGEFPTGSVDCQTVKVEGGFLVLVSSGTLMLIQQVVTFLVREGGTGQPDSSGSLSAANGVTAVLASYLESGDPVFGPQPLVGGMKSLLSSSLAAAAKKFVIAHEYGHILAGHLDEHVAGSATLETKVGAIKVLRKDHAQEFEADDIGYRLTLGVPEYDDFDLDAISQADESDDASIMLAATEKKCLIASPFVLLTVDAILDGFRQAARTVAGSPSLFDTHPPAKDRIKRLLERIPGGIGEHSSFIHIPLTLLPLADRILTAVMDRIQNPKLSVPNEQSLAAADGSAHRTWLDDLLPCVEAIRKADYSAAALALTDAWEAQRTLLDPDAELVCREVVRAALGRTIDLKRSILNHYHERRAVEEHLKRSQNSPLAALLGHPPLSGRSTFAMSAASLPRPKPHGLGLVQSVLDDEADATRASCGEVHLMEAVLYAWGGKRIPSLSAFEQAIELGVADPEGRLSRFVLLEKRALELDVPLGIPELSDAIVRSVVRDDPKVRALAELLQSYAQFLEVSLDPLTQRMVTAQLNRSR